MYDGTEDVAVFQKTRWNCCLFLLPKLYRAPYRSEDSKQYKEHNDARILPIIFSPSPLQSKQNRYNRRYENKYSPRIHSSDFVHLSGFNLALTSARVFEKNYYDEACQHPQRKIDVKAPSPARMIGEYSAKSVTQLLAK